MDGVYIIEKALRMQSIEPLLFLEKNKAYLSAVELDLLKKVTKFRNLYGKLPLSVKSVCEEVDLSEFNPEYPVEFYMDKLRERRKNITFLKVKQLFESELLNDEDKLQHSWYLLRNLFEEEKEKNIVLLKEERLVNAVVRYAQEEAKRYLFGKVVRTGFKTLDSLLAGGYIPSEVYVISGRPKMGKTMYLLHSVLRSLLDGKKVLFISMEMDFASVMKRLFALYFKKNVFLKPDGVFYRALTDEAYLLQQFPQLKNLYFIDGGLVVQLEQIAHYVELEADIDIVFIDGGYLIPVRERFSAEWERVKFVVEGLKRIAMQRRIPIVVTYQLNRAATTTAEVGLQHIAYTDAIGQTAGAVVSVLQPRSTGESKSKNTLYVSGENRRILSVIANRYGATQQFPVFFDWESMEFGDASGDYVEDLPEVEEEDFDF